MATDDYEDSIMIALLPNHAEWSKIKLPHLTLVWAGLKKDLSADDFSNLVKDTASLASISNTVRLDVLGTDVFGGNGDPQVDVVTFKHSVPLWGMRRSVEKWNKSEYDFNPHVTVGPAGTLFAPPRFVTFNKLIVGWGNEVINFNLKLI